jgi:hypothetical protein
MLVIGMVTQTLAQTASKGERVRIAYPSRGVTVLPLRIAQVQGFFQQEHLEAELIQMRAGITVAALTTDDLDYGAHRWIRLFGLRREQLLKAVLSFVNKPMHYLVSGPQIASVRELRGLDHCAELLRQRGAVNSVRDLEISRHRRRQERSPNCVSRRQPWRSVKNAALSMRRWSDPLRDPRQQLRPQGLGHAGSFMELSTPGLGTTDRIVNKSPTR